MRIDTPPSGRTHPLYGVGCSAAPLCVALGLRDVVASTNPAGGSSAWSLSQVAPGSNLALQEADCPAISLCVAVGGETGHGPIGGVIATTTNPTAGGSAWTAEKVVGNSSSIGDVSCPSVSFCAAGDDRRNVFVSSNPAGGPGAFKRIAFPGTFGGHRFLRLNSAFHISCATRSLCVIASSVFYRQHSAAFIMSSTQPTKGISKWKLVRVDGRRGFAAISCPSASFCAAVDDRSRVLTSTHPTGGAKAWKPALIPRPSGSAKGWLNAIDCRSKSFCVATGADGVSVSTRPLAGSSSWRTTKVDPSGLLEDVDCPSTTLCVAVDDRGFAVVGQPHP